MDEKEIQPLEGPEPFFSEEELANLRTIKLINGDDILAVILAVVENQMLVRRPCKIIRIPHTDGTVALILIKWQPFSNEEKHVLALHTVIAYSRVEPAMRQFYMRSVLKQLEEEAIEAIPATTADGEYEWPMWMAEVDKSKVN